MMEQWMDELVVAVTQQQQQQQSINVPKCKDFVSVENGYYTAIIIIR